MLQLGLMGRLVLYYIAIGVHNIIFWMLQLRLLGCFIYNNVAIGIGFIIIVAGGGIIHSIIYATCSYYGVSSNIAISQHSAASKYANLNTLGCVGHVHIMYSVDIQRICLVNGFAGNNLGFFVINNLGLVYAYANTKARKAIGNLSGLNAAICAILFADDGLQADVAICQVAVTLTTL